MFGWVELIGISVPSSRRRIPVHGEMRLHHSQTLFDSIALLIHNQPRATQGQRKRSHVPERRLGLRVTSGRGKKPVFLSVTFDQQTRIEGGVEFFNKAL